ncbi:putative bifunctional diguanylate cyclase/phosphodiesterase [Vampirovibrio chlorellavorus]|uniref:putative bifunctional diguanylate cyclase/phosphodiesterase n=1 Tax=Vampirovibrio chlorellavorus TaxID=758823 RepID=UPI0026F2D8D8|nr:EAL domain-containing protein [Vampirovibrio chlorellavorus]
MGFPTAFSKLVWQSHGPLAGVMPLASPWLNQTQAAPPLGESSAGPFFSGWMGPLAQQFSQSHLAGLIDFHALGWLLFFCAMLVYALNKEQWLRMQREMRKMAMFDPLTGLHNRALLEETVQEKIRASKDNGKKFALMLGDLDRFQQVNDTLGHQAGDNLLKQVAFRLKNILRSTDFVARLGGDEFAIILDSLDHDGFVNQLAQRIQKTLDEPILLDGMAIKAGISMGIVLYPDDGEDLETLMRHVDIALYRAKERRDCFTFYDADMDEYNRKHMQLQNDLREAIKNQDLEAYYQPKVDCNTHQVKGLEALARWSHPERGMISPAEFIPIAKKNNLIGGLTLMMLEKSIQQISQLYHQGVDILLSVNITEQNLGDMDFPETVAEILLRHNFPPHCLELEITEDVIIDNVKNAARVTEKLKNLGVQISIDDFGTGNSSISYLKKLPINTLKIDLSFIREMNRSPDDAAIVKTTIILSKSLGLSVVAEGVEDELTLQRLNDWGCDLAQGFYVCKPIPQEELIRWLEQGPWKPVIRTQPAQPLSPQAEKEAEDSASNVRPFKRSQAGGME